jgi:hypothetical protein
MGFFDLLSPVFTAIQTYALSWLPAWAIVSLYGLLSGILTMVIYTKVSNQDALSAGKLESKESLTLMRELDPDAEFDVVIATMRRAIGAPLKQAKNSLVPALWASLPLIFVMVWLDHTYGYHEPEAGSIVQAHIEPLVPLQEALGIQRNEDDSYSLTWPETGQIDLVAQNGDNITSIPSTMRVPVLHKRQWWNILIANPAGYLEEDAPIEAIQLTLPATEIVSFGPGWLRSWLFFYFAILMSAAIAIKVKFKIA